MLTPTQGIQSSVGHFAHLLVVYSFLGALINNSGIRSFGDDPHSVAKHTVAALHGHLSTSIASTAKHFPGHGDTHVDSHLALPVVRKSRAELYSTELIPFKALIEQGIPSIMTSHVALPSLTPETPNMPASLSRGITTDLLKTELGYKGVVVTDCLEMEAVAAGEWAGDSDNDSGANDGSILGGVAALQAGADIVMICHTMARQRGAVELVYSSVDNGTLSFADIEQSGKSVASLKDKFAGSWDTVLAPLPTEEDFEDQWNSLRADNLRLSRNAYDKSIALVKNLGDAIPLQKNKVILYTPRTESINKAVDDPESVLRTADGKLRNTVGPSYLAFANSVRERVSACQHVVYAPDSSTEDLALEAGAEGVVFTLRNADRAEWQITQLKKVLHEAKHRSVPVVILASCAPYDLMGAPGIFEHDAKIAYVASFEFTPEALQAATKVIFGEMQAVGSVPVCGGVIVF